MEDSEEAIIQSIVPAAQALAEGMTGLGCIISEKTVIVARRQATMKSIQRKLHRRGIQISTAKHAKDLGVGTAGGSRRCTNYLRVRIIKARGRIQRIKMLQKINKKACRMHNTGAWPRPHMAKKPQV